MGRPRKTRTQYLIEYWRIIDAIKSGMSYRKISKRYGVGVSTVMRLRKMIF